MVDYAKLMNEPPMTEGYDKIIIALDDQPTLEEADHDYLTKSEIERIKAVLSAIENAEGVGMPYGTCKRVAVVYQEIREFLKEKETEP